MYPYLQCGRVASAKPKRPGSQGREAMPLSRLPGTSGEGLILSGDHDLEFQIVTSITEGSGRTWEICVILAIVVKPERVSRTRLVGL